LAGEDIVGHFWADCRWTVLQFIAEILPEMQKIRDENLVCAINDVKSAG
jgi:hypothetical protein